ncbi:MAG: ATP-binding protein [Clostridiales bacterium]
MLLRFNVENFLSFNNSQELSMYSSRVRKHKEHTIEYTDFSVLKSAFLYGANASGKSNFVKSISYAKNIIINGISNTNLFNKYFKVDKNNIDKPSKFEFEIMIENTVYIYGLGLLLNKKIVTDEWLYKYTLKSKKEVTIFERENNKVIFNEDILFDENSKKRMSVYIDDIKTMPSSLFLSEIATKHLENEDIKLLEVVHNWFKYNLITIFPESEFLNKLLIGYDKKLNKLFSKYLKGFDTGISEITVSETEDFSNVLDEINNKQLVNDIINLEKNREIIFYDKTKKKLFSFRKNVNDNLTINKLNIIHEGKNNDSISFEYEEESDGTRRLFDLIPLYTELESSRTILIDEFDRSLHPKLSKKFIELFYTISKDTKSQLIVTTHESSLLDLLLVRRDEIWFIEREKDGSSKIFTLDQFKERFDKSVEKAYLLGRYGALPTFKNSTLEVLKCVKE